MPEIISPCCLFQFAFLVNIAESIIIGDYIDLFCTKSGKYNSNSGNYYFAFNVTWLLAPHVAYSDYMDNFTLAIKVIRVTEDPRSGPRERVLENGERIPPISAIVS